MPNTRQELINTLVQKKLYPKKKSQQTTQQILPSMAPITGVKNPLVTQPISGTAQQARPLPIQPSVTKIVFPTKPLQKILFLKRTLGI